jgi:eukaryotic-like serine/threonine-protein kinase
VTESATTEKVVDRYILEEQLGSGGFSTVYRARHSLIGNKVAFKLLLPQHTKSEVTIERFLREAQTAASIGNPHIIKVLDCGTSARGEMFLVMELLQGRELRKVIDEQAPLDVGWSVGVILQVLDALAAAHAAGIVHRDIKPDNIFLTNAPDGSPDFVKLLDFGISKILDPTVGALTTAGEVLGTPMYMAPEQIMGSNQVDHRCDLYSVTAVLYHMLANRTPHEADSLPMLAHMLLSETPTSISAFNQAISADLESIIMRGLAREPELRWSSAHELIDALTPFSTRQTWAEVVDPSSGGASMSGIEPRRQGQGTPSHPYPSGSDPYPAASRPTGPMTSTPSGSMQVTPSGPGYVTPSSPMATPYGDTSAPGYVSSSNPFFSPMTGTPAQKRRAPLWLILVILGVAAVFLGGVTVTIVAYATGAFSSSGSSSSSSGSGSSSSGGLVPGPGPTNNQPSAGNTLRVGQPIMGTLAFGQQLDYPLQITQTRMVTIDLQSSAFDTFLYLLQGQMELMRDDDGGDGFNSRISINLAPGSYTVRVGSYQNSSGGPFVLSLY